MSKIEWASSVDILYDAMFMLHEQGDLPDGVEPQLRPQNLIEEKRTDNTGKLFYSIMNGHGVKDFKFPKLKPSDDDLDEFRSKREAMSKPKSRTAPHLAESRG
ncbi:hypothetical protein F443_14787 [Phytophthora nicotianae P1569]|uniref:Uncharacterized protein n=1 Tax=Phytophthora nicotianae P1569 TaxID=1317065 RepID=V9EK85_PHYNI|nr:hypothetical protein F443_14787 [Phytophthora nicotianae P1569]